MCHTTNPEAETCTTALPATKDRTRPLFSLGQIVATPGVLALFEQTGASPNEYLARHIRGIWGELGPEDMKSNDEALIHGGRLLSAYTVKEATGAKREKFWIVTEWDRSVTTLLMPSEY